MYVQRMCVCVYTCVHVCAQIKRLNCVKNREGEQRMRYCERRSHCGVSEKTVTEETPTKITPVKYLRNSGEGA